MKKKYLFILILLTILPLNTLAFSSGKTKLTASSTNVLVGNSFTVKFAATADSKIQGFDISYSLSGPYILNSKKSLISGMNQSVNGRIAIVSDSQINSGANIYELSLKCNRVGTIKISTSNSEIADKNGNTISAANSSLNITCRELTQAEKDAIEKEKKDKEEKEKAEKEEAAKAENEALSLTEKAEKELTTNSLELALGKVNALTNNELKTSLLDRLQEVKVKIRINDAVLKEANKCIPVETTDSTQVYKIIIIVLIIVIILLTILLFCKPKKSKKTIDII